MDAPAVTHPVSTKWHIDLELPVDTTAAAEYFDIDLFDHDITVIRARVRLPIRLSKPS
jgi:hypothetical protein